MMVRILSERAGSPRCGTVAELPDALARDRIQTGWAEAVTVAARPTPAIEAAVPVAAVETAVSPAARGPRKRGRP